MSDAKALLGPEFDDYVNNSEKPVLVDFWAEWCGPCHLISPILDELAAEHSDEFTLAKIDTDDEANQEIAMRFQIQAIPTMILFKKGEPAVRIMGAKPKAQLWSELEGALAG